MSNIIDDYVVCPFCGKNFRSLKYHIRKKHKEIDLEVWMKENPEFKMFSNYISDINKSKANTMWSKDGRKEWRSQLTKDQWKDESFRNYHSSVSRNTMKNLWKDPEFYKRRVASISNYNRFVNESDNREEILRTRGSNSRLSFINNHSEEQLKEIYERIGMKVSANQKKRMKDNPKFKEAASNNLKTFLNDAYSSKDKTKAFRSKQLRNCRYKMEHNGNTYNFRSSWELIFAKNLILSGFDVNYEELMINYSYEGNNRKYIVDFVIDYDNKVAVEVKPKSLWYDDLVITKIAYCIKSGWDIYLASLSNNEWEFLKGATIIEKVTTEKDSCE